MNSYHDLIRRYIVIYEKLHTNLNVYLTQLNRQLVQGKPEMQSIEIMLHLFYENI